MIELYIEGRKIDLKDDLEINFNYESIDPDKLSTIKNSFSKTVSVPGTPNNNITFGHLFRSDKYIPVAGQTNICNDYDPHKKVNWIINKNGILVNRGYCTLDKIVVNGEREITYNLTLYGGIGEFFYSLSYNDDGSVKNLSDMFWNWYPRTSLYGHGTATTPSDESNTVLMDCSAAIVSEAYHRLSPMNGYTGTTNFENDVVFLPCYSGQYEDFDSKKMLVSTFNQNYNPLDPVMSSTIKQNLLSSFPDSILDYSDDSQTPTQYVTLNKDLGTDGYRYGLASFSREIDPWEAGDLRVNDLPVAVRLSKLLWAISNPDNNGGYTIDWDEDIINSYQWLYGWITLGKLKQTSEDIEKVTFSPNPAYDGQKTTIDLNMTTGAATSILDSDDYDIGLNTQTVPAGKWRISINVIPTLEFECFRYNSYENKDFISGCMDDNGSTFRYVWTTPVLVHKIYSGSTLLKSIADIFYFTTKPNVYEFGYTNRNIQKDDIRQTLNGKINQRFMSSGQYIDQFIYHNCETGEYERSGLTYTFECPNEQIKTFIDTGNGISDLRIEQCQAIMWTSVDNQHGFLAGEYGVDPISFNITSGGYRHQSTLGFISSQNYTVWPNDDQNEVSAYFNMNDGRQNGVTSYKTTGFNIIKLDKETLFANSETPMKYLSGFCKMMNYKIVCDNTSKKISIMPLKKYYVDNVVDINDRVDHSRDITIKNITTEYKTINIGLETQETYPTTIFDRNTREKFNTVRFDTGIRYNAKETTLLDDLALKNLIDWQQNSALYNLHPQFPRAWSLPTISWTLFDKDQVSLDDIKSKEFFTLGCPSTTENLVASKDFMPKPAMFDKNDKYVESNGSLLFLNGFIKNYDYSEVQSGSYAISPRVSLSNDTYEQYYLTGGRCYVYDFKYNDEFTGWGCYSNDQKGSATSWTLPFFTRDLYNYYSDGWHQSPTKLASWNLVQQDGLDSLYSFSDSSEFISDPSYIYQKTATDISSVEGNEYSIGSVPIDGDNTRIWDNNWKDYINDIYDRNAREITIYVDLTGLGDPQDIMRNLYAYDGHLFVVQKIENFHLSDILHDKFTKVTLHKINKKSTWTE